MVFAPQLARQTVLVTGASGFLGSHLCRHLCNQGAKVHAVSRTLRTTENSSLHWWQGDLQDVATVQNLLSTIQPDIIFHVAGNSAAARQLELALPTFQANLMTTVNLLTVATNIGCGRIVLTGSLEEPDPAYADAIPSSPYAASKWASSVYGRMFHALYGTPVVNVRVFMTYGPGQQDIRKLIPYVILSLLQGQAPKLTMGQRQIDWIYVDDVAAGLVAAAQAPDVEGCRIDLGSGSLVPIHTVVRQLVKLVGSKVEPLFGTIPERPFEQVRVADTADTSAKLGWRPLTSLEKGLAATVDWYKRQHADLLKTGGSASN